jgi:hypothetical protein
MANQDDISGETTPVGGVDHDEVLQTFRGLMDQGPPSNWANFTRLLNTIKRDPEAHVGCIGVYESGRLTIPSNVAAGLGAGRQSQY